MNHQRHAIREAVVTALLAAGTSAGSNVDEEPFDLIDSFPHLSVEDESEAQEVLSVNGPPSAAVLRTYRFVVTAQVSQNSNAQRARDQLLADVEACLATASLPGVKSIKPLSYSPSGRNDSEKRIRIGHQLFEAVYLTTQGDPSTSL